MTDGITVRFAAPPDLNFLQQGSHAPAEIVKRKLDWREIIVAERRGVPVGALHIEYLWASVPYIALIYVLPEHRGQGIGRALLLFVETFLREQGHATLYSSSQADEPGPQTWHRHAGFEECGIIAGINEGVGEVFFRKRLS